MPVTASDFISPVGEITGEMFPDEDLEERAEGYLSALTTELGDTLTGVKLDTALTEGVYVRFYKAAAAKAIEKPIMGNLADQGSAQFAANRADLYLKLADSHQKAYDAVFAPEPVAIPARFPSGAVSTRITAP